MIKYSSRFEKFKSSLYFVKFQINRYKRVGFGYDFN